MEAVHSEDVVGAELLAIGNILSLFESLRTNRLSNRDSSGNGGEGVEVVSAGGVVDCGSAEATDTRDI